MSEILAKSSTRAKGEITLSKHTYDALQAFENIKGKIKNYSNLSEVIKIAIFLHDLGKSLPSFQIKSLGNNDYEPWDILYEVPHSLFSILLINKDELKNKLGEEYFNFVISSVAYHHWRENFDDFISKNNDTLINLSQKVLKEWGDKLKDNLYKEFSGNEYKDLVKFIDINKSWLESIIRGRKIMNLAIPPYKFDYEPIRKEVKKEWILISGFLQRCDHFASWCEEEGEDLYKIEIENLEKEEIERRIKERIGENAWQFKRLQGEEIKNTILIAPTGYGKTEFAFLWAKGEKLFYTLPIRSAVNQIFEERAQKIFGEDKTGLLHSDTDVYLLERNTLEYENIKLYDLAKQFSYPVIISTGDQFFPYALRPPGYEKVFATTSYACFVVDEIQAYDPKACAIITKFLEWTYKMGGKFLLITATLPKFVREYLENSIPELKGNIINIYEDEKDNFKRIIKHKLRLEILKNADKKNPKFELPKEEKEKIIEEAKRGKRVLVILNTVNFAQRVYEALKEEAPSELKNNIFLLHSRFTLLDKKNKENKYIEEFKNPKPTIENKGKILVATQVVEASLDIDADVLFTEICPMDALIQRAGRILRRYFYRNGKILNKSDNSEHNLSDGKFRAFDTDPNIHIWIFEKEEQSKKGKQSKKGIQSGKEYVYPEELTLFSIAWLYWIKRKKEENIDIESTLLNKDTEDFLEKELSFLLELDQEKKGEKQKKSKEKSDFYDIILDGNWLNKLEPIEIELSEYDKYILVDLFYSKLRQGRDKGYLSDFYKTIDILNVGWMSERKTEARELFRNIHDVQVITEDRLEDFEKDIERFINDVTENKNMFLFSLFKNEVLSKYVVSIPAIYVRTTPISIYERLRIDISDEWNRRLEKWLSGIYLYPNINGSYDWEKGLEIKPSKKKGE